MDKLLAIPVGLIIIDLCLSIACLTMGTLHLKECENQAAMFLEVNGGITLLLALIATVLFVVFVLNKDSDCCFNQTIFFPPFVSLVKLALAIYGSIVIFGEFEAQIQPKTGKKYGKNPEKLPEYQKYQEELGRAF